MYIVISNFRQKLKLSAKFCGFGGPGAVGSRSNQLVQQLWTGGIDLVPGAKPGDWTDANRTQ